MKLKDIWKLSKIYFEEIIKEINLIELYKQNKTTFFYIFIKL